MFLTFLCFGLLLPSLFCSWPFLAPAQPGPAVPVDDSLLRVLTILRLWVRSLRWLLQYLTLFRLRSVACLCALFADFFVASTNLPIFLVWLGFLVCALLSVGFWSSCLLYPSSASVSIPCSWGFLFFHCCSCQSFLLSMFSRLRLSSLAALVVLPFSSACLSYSWAIACGG